MELYGHRRADEHADAPALREVELVCDAATVLLAP
jgi:hypothetical protein